MSAMLAEVQFKNSYCLENVTLQSKLDFNKGWRSEIEAGETFYNSKYSPHAFYWHPVIFINEFCLMLLIITTTYET